MIRPRQFPFYPEHVPEELKAGRFWVCCDAEKVPKIPGKVHGASSTDPDTWRTYDEAVTALEKSEALQLRYAGVGRVIVNEDRSLRRSGLGQRPGSTHKGHHRRGDEHP